MGQTKVYILYGLCEGPMVSRAFREALQKRGGVVVCDLSDADVIVTHSGGCFLLPNKVRAKRIVHIGLPYWPGRPIVVGMIRKIIADAILHRRSRATGFWLHKTLWNLVYFWKMPSNVRMLRGLYKGALWKHGAITTVVRPSEETLTTPDFSSMPFIGAATFVTVTGQHDQCWWKPRPYIDIILD